MEALQIDKNAKTLDVIALPLQTDCLLMPDIMVFEICEPRQLELKADGPEWLLGNMYWRGRWVPIISFEVMNEADFSAPTSVQRVAVIASLSKHGHLPYYAIVLSGEPSMKRFSRRCLVVHEGRARGRAETLSVEFDNNSAGIPNINWVEQHLLGYILHYKG